LVGGCVPIGILVASKLRRDVAVVGRGGGGLMLMS
jgi:hypothetical protein